MSGREPDAAAGTRRKRDQLGQFAGPQNTSVATKRPPHIAIPAGAQFGNWTVIRRAGNAQGGDPTYLCRCTCGEEKPVASGNLKRKNSKGCRKCHDRALGKALKAGDRFGRWTVLSRAEDVEKASNTGSYYICLCECGTKSTVLAQTLRGGRSTQCKVCAELQFKRQALATKHVEIASGAKFEKWTVLHRFDDDKKHARYVCRCECGAEAPVRASSLRNGRSTRCRECADAAKEEKETGK